MPEGPEAPKPSAGLPQPPPSWGPPTPRWEPPTPPPLAPTQQPPPGGMSSLAIASFVLSLSWIFGLGSLLAVIFGHISLGQIKRDNQDGRGLAIAGLVLGYVGLLFCVLMIVWMATDPTFWEELDDPSYDYS